MRKASGIMLIIIACTLPATMNSLYEMSGETGSYVMWGLILAGLIIASGVFAFKRIHWGLTLAGAISALCAAIAFAITALPTYIYGGTIISIPLVIMGVLAVIFVSKKKKEFD